MPVWVRLLLAVIAIGLIVFIMLRMMGAANLQGAQRRVGSGTNRDAFEAFAAETGAVVRQSALNERLDLDLADGNWRLTITNQKPLGRSASNMAGLPGDQWETTAIGRFASESAFDLHLESKLRDPRVTAVQLTQRGGASIMSGLSDIDAAYDIHASDAARARALLQDPAVRTALGAVNQPSAYIDIGKSEGAWHVIYGTPDEFDTPSVSIERLRKIRTLMRALLDHLARSTGAQPT